MELASISNTAPRRNIVMSRLNSVLVGITAVAATMVLAPVGALAAPVSSASVHAQAAKIVPASSEPTSRIVLKDYPVPASQAYKLLPSDPGVITNGPIPDTPANRARYGEPLSHAGRASAPDGN
jgi:hypothetical protein